MLCRHGKGGAEVRRGGEGEEVGGEEGGRGGSGSSSGAGCCGGLSVLGLLIVREGAGQMGEEVGRRWCGSGSATWCGQRELRTRGGSWAAGVAAGSWVGCHDEARDVAVGPKAAACPRGIIKNYYSSSSLQLCHTWGKAGSPRRLVSTGGSARRLLAQSIESKM